MYYFDPQRFLDLEALVGSFPVGAGGGVVTENPSLVFRADVSDFFFWDQESTTISKLQLTGTTLLLGPSTTTFIVVDLNTGPAFATVAAVGPDQLPLAEVVTDVVGIVSINDLRTVYQKPNHRVAVGGDLSGNMPDPTVASVGGSTAAAINTHITTTGNHPTTDEKAALVGTDGTPSTLNKYVTDSDPRIPTTDEKAALVGTDGTPSTLNKYVTDSDPRLGGTTLVKVLATVPAVNMRATASVPLYLVPVGKSVVVIGCIFKVTVFPTTQTTFASAGLEVLLTSFDILSNQVLTGLGTPGSTNEIFHISPVGGTSRIADAGETVLLQTDLSVSTGVFLCDVDLIGYEY